MYKLHLSTLKYTGVHRFIDLSNRKCDIGRFPSGSALGPSGNIVLFSSRQSLEICTSRPPTPLELPVTFHGGGMDIFWNYTLKKKCESTCMHQVEDSMDSI